MEKMINKFNKDFGEVRNKVFFNWPGQRRSGLCGGQPTKRRTLKGGGGPPTPQINESFCIKIKMRANFLKR